jgi:hypothetical protein
LPIKCGGRPFVVAVANFFFLSFILSSMSSAQQTSPPTSGNSAPQSAPQSGTPVQPSASAAGQDKTQSGKSDSGKDSQSASGQGKVAGTSNDRLFYTLPNFLTMENAGKLPPLSVKDKFKVVARGDFDPVQYPWWAFLAALNQAQNSEPAYGQGWGAYGKRFLTTAADSTIENFMVGAIFPSVLHQDPRYYQSGKGSFAHRTWYAITRIPVTRGDSGKTQFNFSEVFGSAFSAAISTNSYHPRSTYVSTPTNPHMFVASDRTLTNTASVWGTQVGLDTITLVIKEFWPDVHRRLSHKHNAVAASETSH